MPSLELWLPSGMPIEAGQLPDDIRVRHYRSLPGLVQRLSQAKSGSDALVVANPRLGARRALPACVLGTRAIGLYFSENTQRLSHYLRSTSASLSPPRRAVLAQWQPEYLANGRQWLHQMRSRKDARTLDWMADKVGAERLLRRLGEGTLSCVYFGHGRPEGLCAYHGLYYSDLLAAPMRSPVQSFLSFSCQHLAQPQNQACFGRQLVEHGRVRAFWGAVGHVQSDANRQLAVLGAQTLASGCDSIGAWLRLMDQQVRQRPERALHTAWQQYRLIGDPRSPI